MIIRGSIVAVNRLMIPASLLVLAAVGLAQAPGFGWARQTGGAGVDIGRGIAVDRVGNSYIAGASAGIFVAKYDRAGNTLWANRAGRGGDEGRGIAVDGAGNCYVTGAFNGSATFGGTTLTSGGSFDIVVAKYDSGGNVVWAKRAGGAGDDRGSGIAVDGEGNCYVTGFFTGTATFGGTTLNGVGQFDIFVAKYDGTGSVLWAKRAGGSSWNAGNGIAVDAVGNSYVTGECNGQANVFVAKYDSAGNMLWTRRPGGGASYANCGFGIVADGAGNCYVTGKFQGAVRFGEANLTTTGGSWSDIFVAKFNSTGNVVWARQAGGYNPDSAFGIAVDGAGNCCVTGYFQGGGTIGGTTVGTQGFFVAEYDNAGNVVWAQQTGGTGYASGYGIALDGLGHCYVTGNFSGATTFGSTTITSPGLQDGDLFVAMLPVETADLLVAVEAPPTSGTSFTNVSRVILTLRSTIPQALFFYTLDGSVPTPASSAYTGPFAVSNSVTLRVVAYNPVDFTSVESGPVPITIVRGHSLTWLPLTGGGTIAVHPPGDFFTNNASVQLTAVPDPGWAFGQWVGDVQGSTNPVDLVMDQDWRVGAVFVPPPSFTLTVRAVGGGSVSGDMPGNYSPGSIVSLAAQPDTGWLFQGWGGDASGSTTNLSLLMNRDMVVVAYFQAIALVTTTAGGGAIQGNTQPLYPQGAIVTLTAVPDPGWEFLGWMGDSQDTNSTLSMTMVGPRETQAAFGTGLNVTNVGPGTVIRSWTAQAVPWGGTVRLTAIPDAGYFFALWGNAARSTINPLDFVVTNATPTVAALFLPLGEDQVTLTVLADGLGRVVQAPAANLYTNGQTITLTATPAPGQQFLDWSGAFSGSQNPMSLTLAGSQTVTARFTRQVALSAEAIALQNGNTGARVTVDGEIGNNYEVRSSPDLTNWSTFKVVSLFPGEAQFIDSATAGRPQRFFRAVQLP